MGIGDTIKFEGNKYLVIEILEEHVLVIPTQGLTPANVLAIPKDML